MIRDAPKTIIKVSKPAFDMMKPATTGPMNIPMEYDMLYRAYTEKSGLVLLFSTFFL